MQPTEDTYTFRRLPWASKSTILGYRFCQHLFKLRYIDGIAIEVGVKAETGTNMHVLYALFFNKIDYAELQRIPIDFQQDIEDTRVYQYFYKLLMEMIPVDSREYDPYVKMVKNFCLIEADHWIKLNELYPNNISKILKYFIPSSLEKYRECKPLMIYGTTDRKSLHDLEDGVEIIFDYKTGHVPKSVTDGQKYVDDPYSWTLPTNKNFELHFYLILEMCAKGFQIHPDIIAYCTEEKYFTEDAEFPNPKFYFLDRNGKGVKAKDYFRVGIIYTGGDVPYVPKKLPNKRSLRSVFEWINKIRTIIKNQGPFIREPTYWKCRECNDDIREECLSEIEKEKLFWDYESPNSESSNGSQ